MKRLRNVTVNASGRVGMGVTIVVTAVYPSHCLASETLPLAFYMLV